MPLWEYREAPGIGVSLITTVTVQAPPHEWRVVPIMRPFFTTGLKCLSRRSSREIDLNCN